MKHIGTRTLETDRLLLRRLTLDDAQGMYDNWASDPEVTTYLRWPTHANIEVSQNILREWIEAYEKPDTYQWGIVLKAPEELVGTIGVVSQNSLAETVHIGYCIGKRWWKQGITPEALRTVIDFFFRVVGVRRIESQHDPNNPASGRVMRKCGMIHEGTLRKADWNNQGICDAAIYAILREEYPNLELS